MKALWTEERASFRGAFVNFEEAFMWPKPVQQPRPPLLIGGGATQSVFDDVLGWADGWIPVPYLGHTPDDVVRLRHLAEDRGRDPRSLTIVVDGLPADPALFDPWVEIGVDAILMPVESDSLEDVLPVLDDAGPVIACYADSPGLGTGARVG
jgi:hypothetical protein